MATNHISLGSVRVDENADAEVPGAVRSRIMAGIGHALIPQNDQA